MPKLLIKALLFLSPYLALTTVSLCLPLNFFTFRCWEALNVFQQNSILSGPFYPYQKMAMLEEGDLGHGTPYAVKKSVFWETDRYGYRTAPSDSAPDIVIVGDSFAVGSGLSQSEILSELVAKKTGRTVYPYAPRDLNGFLGEARFQAAPPTVVIFEQAERSIAAIPKLVPAKGPAPVGAKTRPVLRQAAILMDATKRLTSIKWLCARIANPTVGYRYGGMFFLDKDSTDVDFNRPAVRRAVDSIIGYHEYFRNRGIKFLFLPVPNKETVYSDFLPSKRPSTFLRRVEKELQDHGVAVLDLLGPYSKCKENGSLPYHADDTHWNRIGVTIAADLIARSLGGSIDVK